MENNDQPEEQKPQVVKLKPVHKHWATWLLAVLVLLLLAAGGYLWMQLQASKDKEQQLNKDKQQLEQQIDKLKGEDGGAAAEEVACTYSPSTGFKDNIKAALDTENTAAFATYTTDPVKYVLAASEFGGNRTPDQAAGDLEYTHSATGPWDFNLPPATITSYDAGFYTDYFDTNTLVGKAASGMVVAFEFSCDGSKISEIFVAADDDLLM